jgi:hypothetical protein
MSQGKLEVAWRAAVGDALNRVTSARLQPEGVVEVHAADARWQGELKRSSPLILKRLKALIGSDEIVQLKIIVK